MQWLHPRLEIHDDLTFSIPIGVLDESEKIITNMMIEPVYDFIIVPLTVESSTGYSWGSLKKRNVFKGEIYKGDYLGIDYKKVSPFMLAV
jgi:hypothetical protein